MEMNPKNVQNLILSFQKMTFNLFCELPEAHRVECPTMMSLLGQGMQGVVIVGGN
jgi:hypothetical protein